MFPSPSLTARLIAWRSRFRGHISINGGKSHKSAPGVRTHRCYCGHKAWNGSRCAMEWDGQELESCLEQRMYSYLAFYHLFALVRSKLLHDAMYTIM
jgi:hypothetical protein